jgi:hypothetical protein
MGWLAVALALGFVVLAYLLVRMRIELRQCTALVRAAIEVLPAAAPAGDNPAPAPAIQPGSAAPQPLQAIAEGGWTVALLVREPEQLDVLPEGDELGRLRSRYHVVAGIPHGHDTSTTPGVQVVPLREELYDHLLLPAVAMIDPEGVVQGVGRVTNGFELLAFVHEGEHHGFGPAEDLDNTIQHAV